LDRAGADSVLFCARVEPYCDVNYWFMNHGAGPLTKGIMVPAFEAGFSF
jgi:hypothetical protein